MIPSSEISFQDYDSLRTNFQHVIRRTVQTDMVDFHGSFKANGSSYVRLVDWSEEMAVGESLFLSYWIRALVFLELEPCGRLGQNPSNDCHFTQPFSFTQCKRMTNRPNDLPISHSSVPFSFLQSRQTCLLLWRCRLLNVTAENTSCQAPSCMCDTVTH